MNDVVQWAIVAIAVAAASVYLYRRLLRPKRGSDCSCCGSCPMGADYAAKCENASQGERKNQPRTS